MIFKKKTVTNRDVLEELPSDEFARWVLEEAPDICALGDSRSLRLKDWLDAPYSGWITSEERLKLIFKD